jgi:tetratricopeptide (TPR) repeat protein
LFATGSEAFGRGDFAAALTAFQSARDAGMDTPAILYDLGVIEYKLEHYAAAEAYFRELGARYPAMRELSAYNIGLSLTRQNRMLEARDAFESARLSDDTKIAALADAMLARIAPNAAPASSEGAGEVPARQSSPTVAGSARRQDPDRLRLVDVGVGLDGNVALVDESSLPVGETTESPLAQVFGLLRGRPWIGVPVSLDASGYLVRYADADEFNQIAVRLGAAYSWEIPGWHIEAGPYYSHSTLAGDGFERRIGASLALRRGLGETSSLRVRLAHEGVNDLEPQFDYIAGTRNRLSLDFAHGSAQGRLALGYAHESNDREGSGVSPRRNEAYAGYELYLPQDWSFEAEAFLRASRYTDLAVPRSEDLTELRFTGRRELSSGWLLEGEWRIGNNDSNDDRYSYDRTRLDVGISKLF